MFDFEQGMNPQKSTTTHNDTEPHVMSSITEKVVLTEKTKSPPPDGDNIFVKIHLYLATA